MDATSSAGYKHHQFSAEAESSPLVSGQDTSLGLELSFL